MQWIVGLIVIIVVIALATSLHFWSRHRGFKNLPTATANIKKVTIDDFDIYYTIQGHGPPLVLVHGIGASLYPWRKIIPMLEKKYTVIALDLPGFGLSSKHPHHDYGLDEQARRVNTFLNVLNIKNPTLVGSSMGGAICLWMAKMFPGNFNKVIALSPAISKRWEAYPAYFLISFGEVLKLLLTPTLIKIIYSQVVTKQENVHHEAIHHYLRPYLADDFAVTVFLKAAHSIFSDSRLPQELSTITTKTLILYGAKDNMVRLEKMQHLVTLLPSAQLVCHPHAGHHSMEDEPQWVVDHINQT